MPAAHRPWGKVRVRVPTALPVLESTPEMSNLSDMQILTRAYGWENDPRRRHTSLDLGWTFYAVGATKKIIDSLVEAGWVRIVFKSGRNIGYSLTEKGRGIVAVAAMQHEQTRVPASVILEATDLLVGIDDLKQTVARAIEGRQRTHFLLEGPPACGKSVLMEGIRAVVTTAFMAFGSRTSAAGLSAAMFENQPTILLLDEADKMRHECYSVLLGLMEKGELLETKSGNTRGILLNTMVIAACNSSAKMPPEFISRFAMHAHFPQYTRQQFIDICQVFLPRLEGCPEDLASTIGELVYDSSLGDVRKARDVWRLAQAPVTTGEVRRVVDMMLRYGPGNKEKQRQPANRFAGI